MNNKNRDLKWYVSEARRNGYRVNGGSNGNGWLNVAACIGVPCSNKGEAKIALLAKFGTPKSPQSVKAPASERVIPRREKSFVSDSNFLNTYEWRRLRMQALKKYGARCQCCGATPAAGAILNVDHIKPRRLFPDLALSLDNLQVLCAQCNHGKGNWDMTDWRTALDADGSEAEEYAKQIAHLREILGNG